MFGGFNFDNMQGGPGGPQRANKKVNNKYKGFTANLVKDAFNWDDNFMQKE